MFETIIALAMVLMSASVIGWAAVGYPRFVRGFFGGANIMILALVGEGSVSGEDAINLFLLFAAGTAMWMLRRHV